MLEEGKKKKTKRHYALGVWFQKTI